MSKKKKTIEELLEEAIVPEEKQRFGIPENWIWTQTGSITDVIGGGTPKSTVKEYFEDGDIPWLTPADLSGYQDMYISRGKRNITEVGLANSSAKILPSNTVLLSSRAPIGYVTIASNDICTNQGFKSFLPSNAYYPEYLYWYLKFSTTYLESMASGTTFKELSGSKCKEIALPLPPINEQKRIADKVEHLLSKIEEAKQLIEEAKETFELRRAAILDKAFRGELTRKWRQNNKDILPVKQFLENIVLKRKETYTEIYERAKQNKEKKPRKIYMDTVPIIDEVVPFLPETWTVTNVEFLGHVTKLAGFEYTKYINLKPGGDVPVIRAQNVQMGKFVKSNIMYIDKDTSDLLSRSQVQEDDILMVFIGAGTGNVCIAPNRNGERWHLAPNVAKISVDAVLPKYLELYLQSPFGQAYIKSKMKATAQPSLSMETIREVLVYLPPLEEQKEIVKTVESLINKVENEVGILKSCSVDGLKQSILSKAFRGELGTNDPSEESAVELLKEVLQEQVK
ncbi:restriction endonuclease subunit S [Bacillus altitudinis]|uniref:restriction endonuclease subunit S n=1 Tax=Bacillus altitudinis TaxID=293387 RepID=UPI000543724D|nr:restriction endonuclease subunit S [Bacillus altitudinis]KWZ65380.1 hypothetical protein HQ51_0215095 [Bacillus altitudinis]UUH73125.1 restriction endonuclease subunit S [Bacillus altitudinis]